MALLKVSDNALNKMPRRRRNHILHLRYLHQASSNACQVAIVKPVPVVVEPVTVPFSAAQRSQAVLVPQLKRKIVTLESKVEKLESKLIHTRKQREAQRKRVKRSEAKLSQALEIAQTAQTTQIEALERDRASREQIQLLNDRLSLSAIHAEKLQSMLNIREQIDTESIQFHKDFSVDADDSFAMKYFLALFKCVQSGSSSRTQVVSFLNCLRGALPPDLNASAFKKFLQRFLSIF